MSKKSVKTMTSRRTRDAATLVLASSSSYRRALLERLGLPFSFVAPKIDEAVRQGELPAATSVRLAEAKAHAVAAAHPNALIIGCEQVSDERTKINTQTSIIGYRCVPEKIMEAVEEY